MIHTFPATPLGADAPEVKALGGHVWVDGERIVVFTDADIPLPLPPVEAVYTESEVVALLKSAGKTDAEAKTMLNAGLVKVIAK